MKQFTLSRREQSLIAEGLKAENERERRSQDLYNPYRKEELAKIREIDGRISTRSQLIERMTKEDAG